MTGLDLDNSFLSPLLETVGAIVTILDKDGRIKFFNRAAEKLTGYSGYDVLERPFWEVFILGDERKEVEDVFNKLFDSKLPSTHENYWRKKDGATALIAWSNTIVTDKTGNDYILAIGTDITHLKNIEESLRRRDEFLQAVFDNDPTAVFIKDKNSTYIFANKATREIFDYVTDIAGMSDADLVAEGRLTQEEANHLRKEDIETLTLRKKVFIPEEKVTKRNGTDLWFQTVKTPIILEDNNIYVLGVAVNITERIATEKQLKLNEKRLETLLALNQMVNEPDEIILKFVFDACIALTESPIGFLNTVDEEKDEFYAYLWSESVMKNCEIAERNRAFKVSSSGLDGRAIKERKHILINSYDAWDGKKKILPAGHLTLKRFLCVPVFDKDKIVYTLGVGNKEKEYTDTDRTQITLLMEAAVQMLKKKRMEAEKDILQNELLQNQKMKAIGTLAGGIAHDFNNILAAILGYTELELLKSDDQSRETNLNQVMKACSRAKDLVRQILTFSRKSNGIEKIAVEVQTICKEVVKFIRAAIPASIELIVNFKSSSHVLANPTQLHQIIMNICTNAFQAMKDGGVMTITLEDIVEQSKRYVVFRVIDTGCGISQQNLKRIFEPFFTTKNLGEGTGMGLAVVHGIVEDLGGSIQVDSVIAEGTSIQIKLPIVKSDYSKESIASEIQYISGNGQRIMLVDDEPAICDSTKHLLEFMGYHAKTFHSSISALAEYNSSPDEYDLIITDEQMPFLEGHNFIKEIRKIRQDVPIILCTGFSEKLENRDHRDFGADDFLMKPLRAEPLSKAIYNLLNK